MGHYRAIFAALITIYSYPAHSAVDSITYTYDALGRLITVTHAGVPTGPGNDGMINNLAYDPLGNRSKYEVSGSKNLGPPQGGVIVLPLNGFTQIPIGQ